MHFREYLEKIEEYGVGSGNTVGVHNDGPGSGFNQGGGMALLPSHWTDTETLQNHLASLDGVVKSAMDKMDLGQGRMPLVQKTGRVMYMQHTTNPIYAHLDDGTRLLFTRGEWERAGKPTTGSKVNVVLQRHPSDDSEEASQVHSIQTAI